MLVTDGEAKREYSPRASFRMARCCPAVFPSLLLELSCGFWEESSLPAFWTFPEWLSSC